ncbi:23S rRNA (adenine(2503)-C(2))-methyltransferase RlmN, partial [Rhizobium leguminosarum]
MSVMDAIDVITPQAPRAASGVEKPSLIGLSREEMGAAIREKGVAEKQIKMRVSQLWNWIYVRGVSDFDHMTNVAKDM